MEPYNVKIILFPDLSKQVRVYKNVVEYVPGKRNRIKNPFNDDKVLEVNNFEHHFESVREVSLSRTKGKIYNYAKCNDWDFFVTFTFSKDKVNRYDYDECTKKLSVWLNNLRKKNPGLSYIVVPEQHKDGAFHFHGLVAGLDESEVECTGKYVIRKIRGEGCRTRFVRTDRKIYRIGRYKLGWMTATEVQDKQRVVTYITKYVTKDMMSGLFGKKRYWASRNLLLPTEEVAFVGDSIDRMILTDELEQLCRYHKVSQRNDYTTQCVEIFEFD